MFEKYGRRFQQALRESSLLSRAFFGCALFFGVLWLVLRQNQSSARFFFLLSGLSGVLWLSSAAMHSIQRNGERRSFNPFALLVGLCVVVLIFSLFMSRRTPNYSREDEPVEQLWRSVQDATLDSETSESDVEALFHECERELGDLQYNLIVTDENDRVICSANNWRLGQSDVFFPLTVQDNDLVLFIGADEQALGAAFRDSSSTNERFFSGDSSLTRAERLSDASSAAPESDEETSLVSTPAESGSQSTRDRLLDLYFPSFGSYITKYMTNLTDSSLRLADGEGDRKDVSVYEWQGERVDGFNGWDAEDDSDVRGLLAELNALTDDEREALKEYVLWYDGALTAASTDGGPYAYVRMYKSSSGTRKVYLIYENDADVLFPNQRYVLQELNRADMYRRIAWCMAPSIVVFLAFWVFTDAKRRGHSAPALWGVLTLIGNVVAWIIYLMVRPQMTVGITGQATPRGVCPLCGTKLRNDFIACPGCGILLRNRCQNCGKALENDWSFCPFCTAAVPPKHPSDTP